jgi:hypothetical protein
MPPGTSVRGVAVPSADQFGRAQLLERLAMALRSVGRWDDALRTMDEALDQYEALGQVEAIGRLGWAMVYQLVWSARLVEGVHVGQRTLAALGNTVSADKARLLSALGWALSVSGDYVAATYVRPTRALAEQVGVSGRWPTCCTADLHHRLRGVRRGIRIGLRAAGVRGERRAVGSLQRAAGSLIYEGAEHSGVASRRRVSRTRR